MSDEITLKLDLGCGPRKVNQEDPVWFGIDSIDFDGVDVVTDLSKEIWDFGNIKSETFPQDVLEDYSIGALISKRLKDNSVDEIHTSHFVEHLTGAQRVLMFNEAYRVLKPNGKMVVVCPNWSHERAYGDPTHQWPPVCSWTFYYLGEDWRKANAPHTGYTCNFGSSIVGIHDQNDPWINYRNMETKTIMMSRNINTTTDIIATLNKIQNIIPDK